MIMWTFISVMSVMISGLPHGKALLYFRNLFSCFLISALIHFLTSIHIFSFPGFLFNPLSCTTATGPFFSSFILPQRQLTSHKTLIQRSGLTEEKHRKHIFPCTIVCVSMRSKSWEKKGKTNKKGSVVFTCALMNEEDSLERIFTQTDPET